MSQAIITLRFLFWLNRSFAFIECHILSQLKVNGWSMEIHFGLYMFETMCVCGGGLPHHSKNPTKAFITHLFRMKNSPQNSLQNPIWIPLHPLTLFAIPPHTMLLFFLLLWLKGYSFFLLLDVSVLPHSPSCRSFPASFFTLTFIVF